MKPLLIGQAPGSGTDPGVPVSGRCGARLAALCGLTVEEFLERFDRDNLVRRFPGKDGKGDAFPIDAARKTVVDMLLFGTLRRRRVVLLGDKVAQAFGFRRGALVPMLWNEIDGGDIVLALCPHPSGINRWWNDHRNVAKARRFWRRLAEDGG